MTVLFSFPQTSLADGNHAIPVTSLGTGWTTLSLTLARCTTATPTVWPSTSTTIDAALEVSYDGGTTWVGGGEGTAQGGIYVHHGVEAPSTVLSFRYSSAPTHVRGNIAIAGGPLVTSGSVSVT